MKAASGRPAPRITHVVRSEDISENMKRIVVSGDELLGWPEDKDGGNIKLLIPEPDWSQAEFRDRIDNGPRPIVRTYTARHYDGAKNELWIDFVIHEGGGPASDWAALAAPGSMIGVAGPSGTKLTTTDADWFLICADMSAMPAAEAALESLPASATGQILFEVQSEDDKREIYHPPGMQMNWLIHKNQHSPSRQQMEFSQSIEWPTGRVAAFVAGEAGVIREFRRWLLNERAINKEDMYVSGYWKIGLIEDEHQAEKRANK